MVDLSIVNKESLEFLGACKKGKKWFIRNIGSMPVNKINEIEGGHEEYIDWLKNKYPVSIDGMKHTFKDGSMRSYDKNGKILSYTDQHGRRWTRTFDDRGNILSYTDSDGYSWTLSRDEKGNALSYVDSNGFKWIRTYDNQGNVLSHTDSGGSNWTKTYDERGSMVSHIVGN